MCSLLPSNTHSARRAINETPSTLTRVFVAKRGCFPRRIREARTRFFTKTRTTNTTCRCRRFSWCRSTRTDDGDAATHARARAYGSTPDVSSTHCAAGALTLCGATTAGGPSSYRAARSIIECHRSFSVGDPACAVKAAAAAAAVGRETTRVC